MESKMSLQQIDNLLTSLHIYELDNSLGKFLKDNCAYFSELPIISREEENGYYFMKNSSTFELKFIPSYLNVEQIKIELKNLEGMSVRAYFVEFDDKTISIKQSSQFISLNGNNKRVRKTKIVSEYYDLKKSFEKKYDTITTINNEESFDLTFNQVDDYTKEEVIYYPNLDSGYLEKCIVIGNVNSTHPTNVRYIKGTLESHRDITENEYIAGISVDTSKVLKKVINEKVYS